MATLYTKLHGVLTDKALTDSDSDSEVIAVAPKNFVLLLVARAASKLGDRLASPKTTIAWLLESLGASSLTLSLMVPLREAGALLPQVFMGGYLKAVPLRKWAWSIGSFFQGLCIAGVAGVAFLWTGALAGWLILFFIGLFSLARGLSSIAGKDVLGKTIPKSQRGQLTGWAGSISGMMALISAGVFFVGDAGTASIQLYTFYLLSAACIWWLAGAINARVIEHAGETESIPHPVKEAFDKLSLLRSDKAFRHFVMVRTFAFGSGLSTPFVISMAYTRLSGAAYWLGVFIFAEGLAAMLASPLWGRFADRSSRGVLRVSMFVVAVILGLVLCLHAIETPLWVYQITFPLIIFALGIAHSGVRVGRKTYIVNMAKGNQRTDYVSVANTLIGIFLLIVGALTGLVSLVSIEVVIGIFLCAALLGSFLGRWLPGLEAS